MYKLRELDRGDLNRINSWRTDKELIDKLGAPFRYINKEVDYEWYEHYKSNRANTIRCSIINNNEKIIGLVSLIEINRLNQTAEFQIMIAEKSSRSKGAGEYATSEMLKHAFLDMNLNRVELYVLKSNASAMTFYTKLGFIKEGVKRKSVYKNGDFEDLVIMSILKNEFVNPSLK